MDDQLESSLQALAALEGRIIKSAEGMLSVQESLYPLDYLISAAHNRTIVLTTGYIELTRGKNFLCAVHLVRLNLDTFLRLGAVWLVDDTQAYAQAVLEGREVGKLKDRDGKQMKDAYLKECLSEEHPWIEEVYKQTSGFVHLSRRHFSASIKILDKEEGTIKTFIGREDQAIKTELKLECTKVMIEIIDRICDLVDEWSEAKAT